MIIFPKDQHLNVSIGRWKSFPIQAINEDGALFCICMHAAAVKCRYWNVACQSYSQKPLTCGPVLPTKSYRI